MSRLSPSSEPPSPLAPSRRRKHPLGVPSRGWGTGDDEAWACPPSARRSRWDKPGSVEPPAAVAAGPGPPLPLVSWAGRRPRDRPTGELWDGPDSQRPRGSPPREAAWECIEGGGSLGQPFRQWGAGLGGGRWRSPQRTGGGGRRSPSPGQGAWDSPKAPRRQQGPDGDTRGWGSPGREGSWEHSRNPGRPAWEQKQGSPGGSRGRRREGSPGRDLGRDLHRSTSGWSQASREQAVGSSTEIGGSWGRTNRRGRKHHSPTRKQSSWGSPKSEARQEHSGSTRHDAREQGQVNPGEDGSSWSSTWCRDENYQNFSRDEGRLDSLKREWQSPNGQARGWGSPMRYRGGEDVGEAVAEKDRQEREDEEKGTYATGSGSPEMSASPTPLVSGSSAVPKRWTPCEAVVRWWMHCRSNLRYTMQKQLMSICPRPTLPERSAEIPQINPDILSLLKKKEEGNVRRATQYTRMLQNEVLDMLAPAMTICEMAEEAIEKSEPVDPKELREWSRHLIRFIVSLNHRLTLQSRYQVLGAINTHLRSVASKMKGRSTEGMLFAEDKVKLLKEIIKQFPELSETAKKMPRRRFHTFTQAANNKQAQRRPPPRSRSKTHGTGLESYKRGTAAPRVDKSQNLGTEGQGPAEWH